MSTDESTNGASKPNGSTEVRSEPPAAPDSGRYEQRTASDDLAEGLGLLVRAARRAIEQVDKDSIEDLGRRAKERLEHIDRKSMVDFSRKAVQSFDAEKVEEFSREAGRELMSVVDRLANRVEEIVDQAQRHARGEPPPDDGSKRLRIDDSDDDGSGS